MYHVDHVDLVIAEYVTYAMYCTKQLSGILIKFGLNKYLFKLWIVLLFLVIIRDTTTVSTRKTVSNYKSMISLIP